MLASVDAGHLKHKSGGIQITGDEVTGFEIKSDLVLQLKTTNSGDDNK